MDAAFEKAYFRANVPAIVENCITGALWFDEPLFAARDRSVKYVRDYHYVPAEHLEDAVTTALRHALASSENFRRFLNERRKTWVRPAFRTTKQYLQEIYGTAMTEEELRLWCQNRLPIA